MGRLLAAALACLLAIGCGDGKISNAKTDYRDPTCMYSVYLHDPHAWLIKRPKIRFVFLGSTYWNENWVMALNVVQGWDDLITNEKILPDLLSEYGIQDGIVSSKPWMMDVPGALINDSLITKELSKLMLNGDLPVPDSDTLYIVMLPPGVQSAAIVANGWGGYHGVSTYGPTRYAFSIISSGQGDITISHEIYEAVTDPDARNGYYDDVYSEVADICNGVPHSLGAHTVQKVFSQKACQCL